MFVSGDVQVNDTHLHHKFKKLYRTEEQKLMFSLLEKNPKKIPAPDRQQLIDIAMKTMDDLDEMEDFSPAFKQLFLTNKLDGTEDRLIGDNLKSLVYEDMVKFRKKLLRSTPPDTIEEMFKTLKPPKGVKRRTNQVEGGELYDHDDEGLEMNITELTKEFEGVEEEKPSEAFVDNADNQFDQRKQSSTKFWPLAGKTLFLLV